MSQVLFGRIVEISQPFPLPGDWGWLTANCRVRRFPVDAAAALATLCEQFPDAALENAGVAIRDAGGQIVVTPALASGDGVFLPLHRERKGLPYDLLTAHGQLTSSDPPCLTALSDDVTREGVERFGGVLFAAFSMRHLAFFQGLKLPATLAVGLERLDGRQLRRFCGFAERGQCPVPLWNSVRQLVLVAWSPGTLPVAAPDGLGEVVCHLRTAQECFGFDLSQVRVWRPSEVSLEHLKAVPRFRDASLAREAILASVRKSSCSLEAYCETKIAGRTLRELYLQKRTELVTELEREQKLPCVPSKVPRLHAELNRLFERMLAEGLAQQAVGELDLAAWGRNQFTAELIQELHYSSRLIRGSAGEGPYGVLWQRRLEGEDLKRRLTLIDKILKIDAHRHRRRR